MNDTSKDKRGKRKSVKASNKTPVKASNKASVKTSDKKSDKAKNNKSNAVEGNKPLATRDDTKIPSEGFSLTWMAIALVVIGIAVLVYAGGVKFKEELVSEPKTESATSKSNMSIGGPFSLVDHEGNAVTDLDFRGQYLLIYFGYTYCPDVCPTALTDMSDALEKLGAEAGKVTPILITIDPVRDTPEHLKEYASFFHPRLRALTGTPQKIAAVAKAYRVYFNRAKQQDSAPDDYLMDHSSAIYLMGPDGTFRFHFSHGTDAEIMARRIRDIIS